MKTVLFPALALLVLLAAAPIVRAAEASGLPPLLCDEDMLKSPSKSIACPPAPACPPAAPLPACPPVVSVPVCPPAPQNICRTVEVPVRRVVNEVRTVPVKKRIYEEECYPTEERRTEIVEEQRTRTAHRRVPVLVAREYSDVKIVKTASAGGGRAPRLSRVVSNHLKPVTVMKTEAYEENYTVKVRNTVMVPVVKTRRVAREVEEMQTITVPTVVTVMETRTVN